MKHPLIKLSQSQIDNIKLINTDSRIKFEKVSCLNCGSENHMNLFTNDRYGFNITKVLCNKCGLMFTNPMLTKNSADFFYNSNLYRNLLHPLGVMDNSKDDYMKESPSFNFINSLDIKYQTVCDVGSGNGNDVRLYKSIGKEACGYEPSKLFTDLGKKRGLNIINGWSEDVKGEYDLVIMKHVLEHLINPKKAIENLRKNVKKYLIIEIPVSVDKFQCFQYSHAYYFSINTLCQIITKCGFKKIHIKHESRSVNDNLYVLFERTDEKEIHSYDYTHEVKKYKKIYYKYFIKSFIKKIIRDVLKKINPNIEKKIVKIIDLSTLGY